MFMILLNEINGQDDFKRKICALVLKENGAKRSERKHKAIKAQI